MRRALTRTTGRIWRIRIGLRRCTVITAISLTGSRSPDLATAISAEPDNPVRSANPRRLTKEEVYSKMAKMKTMDDLLLSEMKDLYDAEKQLVKALPKMARAATSEELREGFLEHLEQTKGHVTRLEKAFSML